jgi:UPF0176 protein
LSILNIAFYQFKDFSNLDQLRSDLQNICQSLEIRGTILLSSEGVNGTVAGPVDAIRRFQFLLEDQLKWIGIEYKESYSGQIPHSRMLVKLKKEIIPSGRPEIRPHEKAAPRISPQDLKTWLDSGKDFSLLDTRNRYEIDFGTFEKAAHLDLRHFRDFFKKEKELNQLDRKKPLVMFCTGGIRCEKAAAEALNQGFEEVYQLDGGILKYFEECGGAHYKGSCFVFDFRVAVDEKLKPITSSEDKN